MKSKGALVYILFLFIFLSQAALAQVHFTARLTGMQEVPSDTSKATGTAAFTLTDEGLTYIIAVDSIGKITGVEFHYGAPGDTGSVFRSILSDFKGNIAYGVWKADDSTPLTGDIINALLTGKVYLNVSTEAYPQGEIRGQVLATSGTSLSTVLSQDQEVPAVVNSVGSGTGSFLLTDQGLVYSITINGLSDITEAHFHLGTIGVSGDVIRPVTIANNRAVGIWSKTDASDPLTDRWITALLTDSVYFNVHTKTNPDGEIRGQVHLDGGIGFYANMTGSQEVPTVNTTSKATGYFVLTNKGLTFNITVDTKDSIIAAQFYKAPAGMIGGVVRTLNELKGKTAQGIWKFDDPEPLSAEILSELLKGNVYINMMTAKNPTGEVRGQLTMINGSMFTANLSPAQVRPDNPADTPKNQAGTGTAVFYFTNEGLAFNISLANADTLKSAHLVTGKIGKNGTIVKGIREFVRYTANGVWTYTDTLQTLTPDLISKLFKGEIYLNVRTKVDTLGGLRGQLLLTNGTNFRANLTGSQQVPKVATNAKGTGSFTLTNEGLAYKITVDSIVISGAHFHLGEPGVSGGVVKDIIADFVGNTATGIWRTTGNQALTPDLIKALMTGKLYFSVHSPGKPMGELRGQIVLNGGWGFNAYLDGTQEVPAIATTAQGNASLTLTPAGLIYDATLTGLNPTSLGIYKGPEGQNGSLVHSVSSDFKTRTVSDVWLTMGSDSLDFDNFATLFVDGQGLYFNAATAQNPNGEIRGQIVKLIEKVNVSTAERPQSPKTFSLGQNYPNPFNPSTSIRFTLPNSGLVNLTIYNMLGQRVATLMDRQMNAGSYEVKFDASRLPSGMYLYRLSAGDNVSVKKMMLLK
ncbi:MAG TPA: CHRD domain-containing protein [Ignavibacteriales bacterium]|nr:CHRD domain-containing protein [Ignavibacteriales bacterium]